MIQICPAILENKEKRFDKLLAKFNKHFKTIDIDINAAGDEFPGKRTIRLDYAIEKINQFNENKFNIHLMVDLPTFYLHGVEEKIKRKAQVKFLIHQEYLPDTLEVEQLMKKGLKINIAINPESDLLSLDYYEKFSEIQLMTVKPGSQGNKFIPWVLDRVEWLKEIGFEGKISIDGGVNPTTAELIRKKKVDRVSVGSYFTKATNIRKAKKALEIALE